MATTTIRLDEALKARLAAAAEREGKTAHGFILDALAETLDRVEQEDAFQRLAEARWAGLLATGESVSWAATKTWLEARAGGEALPRPLARNPAA